MKVSFPAREETVFSVSIGCSVSVAFGAIVAIMQSLASSFSELSRSKRVRLLALYGTYGFFEDDFALARMHSFSAYKLALISLVSFFTQ